MPLAKKAGLVREREETWEAARLASGAARSQGAGNRKRDEVPDPLRTAFQRDRDRVIHSRAFRRLKHKTQVFIAPDGDHYRTRLTHTLEVAQIARTIARALRLNEDLAEAIALAHDLGHTPFGHLGEEVFSRFFSTRFHHAEQGLRVVELIEPHAEKPGLNLTDEVRDGIVHSSWNQSPPCTHEAWVVRFADRIAYLNHDLDDAVRAGLLASHDLPEQVRRGLGNTASERIATLVTDVLEASCVDRACVSPPPSAATSPLAWVQSSQRSGVRMGAETFEVMHVFREFMFDNVYRAEHQRAEKEQAVLALEGILSYYLADPARLPPMVGVPGSTPERQVMDYIAGMTDRFALSLWADLQFSC